MENKFFNPRNFIIGIVITCTILVGLMAYELLGWYSVFVPLGFLAMFGIGYIVRKIFKID